MLVAAWYAGLTVLALAFAYRDHGLGRLPGAVIIAGYLAFVAALGVTVAQGGVRPAAAVVPAAVIAVSAAALLAWPAAARGGAPAGVPAWWSGNPAARLECLLFLNDEFSPRAWWSRPVTRHPGRT